MLERIRSTLAEPSAAPAAASDAIDLRQVQDFFWRRWQLILATAAVIAVVTFIVLLAVTPRYTATAQVLLDPGNQKLLGAANLVPELSLDSSNVDSQVSLIRSTNLLRRVVDATKLTQDGEFGAAGRPGLFSLLTSWFSKKPEVDANAAPGSSDAFPPEVLSAVGHLRSALEVTRLQRTYVIGISVTSEDPVKAARLANAVAEAYVVDSLNARYEAAKTAANWLAQRMEGMREQVQQSELAVANFRREHNLVTTSSETKLTISEQQLSELNAKLVTARAETAAHLAAYEQVAQVQAGGGNLQTVPEVIRSPVISQLRNQQAVVAQKVAELGSRYNSDHPEIVRARAELRDINNSIANETGRIISNLKNEYDVSKARADSLEKSLNQISGANGLDNVGIRLRELERINAANKTLFENFLSQSKITAAQSTFDVRDSRVISPASKGSQSFPRKTLVLSLALVVGCLIGIGGGVALDMLNSGFTTQREIEEKLGIPVLASISLLQPAERTINGKVYDPPSYCYLKPLSRYAEAVRTLRMGVQMADVDNPAKVVMVTSSVPQESKSTIVLSLAYSALKAGLRTAVIDGDLRHPSVSRFFGLHNSPGLVDLLTGTTAMEQTIVTREGLTLIPAGSKSQNPPDLLGSARMKSLVEQLRETHDYVIIDTPPVGPVIDAKVTMQLADKVIFVVRWQSTSREMVTQSIDGLGADRKLAGLVLSMVDETKVPRYGPYSYYSSYHYKNYYQN